MKETRDLSVRSGLGYSGVYRICGARHYVVGTSQSAEVF